MSRHFLPAACILALCISCKTKDSGNPGQAPPANYASALQPGDHASTLQSGDYRDESGGRMLRLTKLSNDSWRVEITGNNRGDRFADVTSAAQVIRPAVFELQGINQVSGNRETLRISTSTVSHLDVERLGVPFPETMRFTKDN